MPENLDREITSLGIYFALDTHQESSAADPPWRSLAVLLDGSDALRSFYEQFRATLGRATGRPVEFRVAASTGHLALVARLICPAFGAELLGHHLDLTQARWQPVTEGVMPLSLPTGAIGVAGDISALLTGPIRTLTELTAGMSVSSKVLWGNVSSAVNGAVMGACRARPDLAARSMALGRSLGTAPGPDFRRTSCCLIYRIAPPGDSAIFCGDCVLERG